MLQFAVRITVRLNEQFSVSSTPCQCALCRESEICALELRGPRGLLTDLAYPPRRLATGSASDALSIARGPRGQMCPPESVRAFLVFCHFFQFGVSGRAPPAQRERIWKMWLLDALRTGNI
jgi:hypothetical protein